MPTLHFTVDAELLRELGEHLVGKPYIALAELVKNSYDADATKVTIELDPEKDRITVSDNGHGMDFTEFKNFWMRIGSVHKTRLRISRRFKRPLTGSKGIGRLAVQFLAEELDLCTVSEKDLSRKLESHVKWKEAVSAGDLTKATAGYNIEISKEGFEQRTSIVLTGLNHKWNSDLIKGLAREIWWLQPPFRSPLATRKDPEKAFEIKFVSPEKDIIETFNRQIRAIFDIWYAKLVGKNENGKVTLSLEFAGEDPIIMNYSIDDCELKGGGFEIRTYHLTYRQPHGIKVGEAREYLNEFGGVHVYDGGFHLPYYGDRKNDWLRIEFDHSHRLSMSQLLPKELRVEEGMTFLPTLSRIFGVVNVDTSKEPYLNISITRDRLQESKAFSDLFFMARWAMDFYANEEAKRQRKWKDLIKKTEAPEFERMEDVLTKYQSEIPEKVYGYLHKDMQKATKEIETEAEATAKRIGLLGSLATAGISSLAYQHELKQQFHTIDDIVKKIGKISVADEKLRKTINELKEGLLSWVERARATNALFAYLADPENIEMKKRFSAKKIVEEINEQVKVLTRGIPIDTSRLDDDLLLPKASLVECGSIFQNVFINAFNAMLDSKKKLIDVSSRINGRVREILVQDTGCGVNLRDAETLFEPFERRMKISPERQTLGYGGTGLGLTIVRLIANNLGCTVSFVEPEKGFNTAFSIRWREIE